MLATSIWSRVNDESYGTPESAVCAGLKTSGPQRSTWWRRRESTPRPKAFDNDVYMRIRVVAGTRPGGAFPCFGPAAHQPGESRRRTYP